MLRENLWKTVDLEITLKDCTVYSYHPDPDSSPFPENQIWSFLYFFYNKGLKKLVTFLTYTTLSDISPLNASRDCKVAGEEEAEEEEEEEEEEETTFDDELGLFEDDDMA